MARFDHTGKTYGSVTVVSVKDADKNGPLTYWVDLLCCGTRVEMTQKAVGFRKNDPTSQCADCRANRNPKIDLSLENNEAAVKIPGWGTFLPLSRPGHRHGGNMARRASDPS